MVVCMIERQVGWYERTQRFYSPCGGWTVGGGRTDGRTRHGMPCCSFVVQFSFMKISDARSMFGFVGCLHRYLPTSATTTPCSLPAYLRACASFTRTSAYARRCARARALCPHSALPSALPARGLRASFRCAHACFYRAARAGHRVRLCRAHRHYARPLRCALYHWRMPSCHLPRLYVLLRSRARCAPILLPLTRTYTHTRSRHLPLTHLHPRFYHRTQFFCHLFKLLRTFERAHVNNAHRGCAGAVSWIHWRSANARDNWYAGSSLLNPLSPL